MSAPPEIFALCYTVCVGPTLGVMAVDHRSRTGEWPQPHRLDWRWLTGELGDAIAGGISSWARAWRREAKPLVRVAEILLSLGLMIRAGIWSAACAVGGDGSPEVRHGFDAEPIAGARLDTRVGIAVLELAIVGVWSQWAPVVLAWPPGIVTAASLIWVAQAGPLLWDTPLTAYAIIQTMIQSDSTPTTEVNR